MAPSLKVDLHSGAMAEGVLTFVIMFAVLWIMIKSLRSSIIKTLILVVATVVGF
ncbi:Aquaporin SIP1-1 [Platanthera guangdongensis]|uniref:Aquaporin SIP1-1 n=1 Tax=Platanthera guangdongensis TaxID=2320717 RepID=A0ABR2M7U7_9ASPA